MRFNKKIKSAIIDLYADLFCFETVGYYASLPPSGEVAKWSVSEILTIGDKNAMQNVVVIYCPLSPQAALSPKGTARKEIFSEGESEFTHILCRGK